MNQPPQSKGRPQREPETALIENVEQAESSCGAANVNQPLPPGIRHVSVILSEGLLPIIEGQEARIQTINGGSRNEHD